MSKTKRRILESARQLLNESGLSAVSQRTIADYLNISPGNLTYHYKKRSDIIEALYFELVVNIDEAIFNLPKGEGILAGLYHLTKVIMENFYEYRFLFLDFIQVMRENSPIKKHYMKLLEQREKQFTHFFQLLINQGLMRKEELPNEYAYLLKRMAVVGDFWLAAAEFNRKSISKKQITEYLEINSQAIYPYLTAKGKRQYKKITTAS